MFKILKPPLNNSLEQIVKLILLLFAVVTSQPCYSEASEIADNYYENAVMEYHNGNINSAILELKNAIRQNPDSLTAQILLAELYLKNYNLIATEVALAQSDKLGADPELLLKIRAKLYLYQLKYDRLLKEILPMNFNKNLRTDIHIYRGHAYLQLNQYGYALSEYKSATQLEPKRIEPIIGRANVLLRLDNIQGAIDAADKAAKLEPDSADSWYIKASIKHTLGRLQEALADYGRVLKINPEHHDTLIARAGVLMDLNRDAEAESDLLFLRETYPFDARASYLHAVVLARNNRPKEAIEALSSASEALEVIKPKFLEKHAQSLMLSALVNYSLKNFDLAQHALKKYTQQYPQQPGPAKLLGSILLDKGEYDRVIKLLKPMLSYAPKDYRLLFILGNAYMQNGQHDKANAMLEKASRLEVHNTDLSVELGLSRLAMGQDTLAINELENAIKKDPGNIKAGIPLTIIYMKQHQAKKAMQVASKMYQLTPDNLTLLNLLGTTQVGVGNRKLARENFEKAVTKNADFITAHINLSKLDVIENNPEAAKKRLSNLIEFKPKNIALLVELAKIYMSEANYEAAIERLEKAGKIDPHSLLVKLSLIELKLKTGRNPEALALAQETKKDDRDNMQVLDLLARSFIANGNNRKASGVLKTMSDNTGFNSKRLYQIAQKQFAVKDYKAAIKTLKNAILGDKHYIPARIALAEAELKYGELFFASNHANFLLENYPDQPFGHRLLGDIAQKEKKNTQSIKYYQQAFDKKQNTFLLMKLYTALKQSDSKNKAFRLIQKWVASHQTDAVPVMALAEEHLSAGRLKEAQKYYEQLLKRFPKRPDLLNNLAYIYFAIGDERALDYAQQAQQLAPEQAAANDTVGWILVNQGQPELGLQYLRNAHARSSQDPEIRYHIAVALNQLQRYEEAKTELKQALQKNQRFNGSDDARLLLEKLNAKKK